MGADPAHPLKMHAVRTAAVPPPALAAARAGRAQDPTLAVRGAAMALRARSAPRLAPARARRPRRQVPPPPGARARRAPPPRRARARARCGPRAGAAAAARRARRGAAHAPAGLGASGPRPTAPTGAAASQRRLQASYGRKSASMPSSRPPRSALSPGPSPPGAAASETTAARRDGRFLARSTAAPSVAAAPAPMATKLRPPRVLWPAARAAVLLRRAFMMPLRPSACACRHACGGGCDSGGRQPAGAPPGAPSRACPNGRLKTLFCTSDSDDDLGAPSPGPDAIALGEALRKAAPRHAGHHPAPMRASWPAPAPASALPRPPPGRGPAMTASNLRRRFSTV